MAYINTISAQVLLFYPDGKKSSSTEGNIGGAVAAAVAAHAGPPPAANGAPEGLSLILAFILSLPC